MTFVRRICAQQEIAIATFPVENFSSIQLEHVAISPWRTRRLFMTPTLEQPIQPFKIQLEKAAFKQVYTVPGGRFLLTNSTAKVLQLWDLGFLWDTVRDWRLLASMQLQSDMTYCIDILPTCDGAGLQVLLKDIRL